MTFEDFCATCKCSKLVTCTGAKAVYDFLSSPTSVCYMITFSNAGIPAITGIAYELETRFANIAGFELTNAQNRRIVGRMIRFIMTQFGFDMTDELQKLRHFSDAELFKAGAVYAFTGAIKPTYKIGISIEHA